MSAVGGCHDSSLIIDFLAAYLFPNGERAIEEFAATGISLGGQFTSNAVLATPALAQHS